MACSRIVFGSSPREEEQQTYILSLWYFETAKVEAVKKSQAFKLDLYRQAGEPRPCSCI